ncbi:MAG: nitrilase-related carbon-nitrogen hydrolase [Pseudomonadota bacterium]
MTAYRAMALQLACDAVNGCRDREAARALMRESIDRIGRQLAASKRFVGPDLRLVVLPEYFLTGFPMGETPQQWHYKACLTLDDPLYGELGAIATANDVYLSGNAYEIDPAFPDLYFQTSFIIEPGGEVALRYRRLVSMFAPTPHDVWDRYLEVHGFDAVFPVLDCELGRLACVASEEILYPEISRAFALRGAEVLLHSSSEVGSPADTVKGIARRARAVENQCYLVSANSAGIRRIAIPECSTDGHSQILDHQGRILAEADTGESMVTVEELDITALRRARTRPGMGNLLSRQRLELFAPIYGGAPIHAANSLLDGDGNIIAPERSHFAEQQRQALVRLAERWQEARP